MSLLRDARFDAYVYSNRSHAGRFLGKIAIGKREVVDGLLDMLPKMDRPGCFGVIEALGYSTEMRDRRVTTLFLKLLDEADSRQKQLLARFLGEVPVQDENVISALYRQLEHRNYYVRLRAGQALCLHTKCDEQVVNDVRESLPPVSPGAEEFDDDDSDV